MNIEGNSNTIERQQEAIHNLEKLGYMSHQDKINLLAVYKDLKPASQLDIEYYPDGVESGEKTEQEFEATAEKLKNILDTLDIKFEMFWEDSSYRKAGKRPAKVQVFYISKDIDILNDLILSQYEPGINNKLPHVKDGKMFGFPETAINAYSKAEQESDFSNLIDPYNLPDEIRDTPEAHFISFRMSKDHWKEEFKHVKKVAAMVREVAPDLYEDILKEGI